MVVDTNSERVAIEVDVVGAGQAAICLEGNVYRLARLAESMQPLDGIAVRDLDATTNPEGGPKEGEEVSLPLDFAILCLRKATNTDNMSPIMHAQWPISGATPVRARQETSRPPPETRRARGDRSLAKIRRSTGDRRVMVEVR